MGQIRQGDVLLIPVAVERPADARVTAEVVLAEGELTGHAHRLSAPQVWEWKVLGQRHVQVGGAPGTLTHEDHDPQGARVVEEGATYRVVRQQQLDLSGQWRQVRD